MKIMHIITSMETGGAETTLARLVRAMDQHTHVVVSLTTIGSPGNELIASGHEVIALNMRASNLVSALARLWQLIRQHQPDVIQTWMYHSDLLGGLMGWLSGCRNIYWNIRNTNIPQGRWSTTGMVIRACAALSRWVPRTIVCCAHSGLRRHVELGYQADRMVVIPNGYDLDKWQVPLNGKDTLRSELGLPLKAFIVGMVGRFDPLKGHDVFVEAAGEMTTRTHRELLFLMVGRQMNQSNVALQKMMAEKGGKATFKLMDERKDIAQIMSALDVYCLSSKSEGFPNVVAEAMLMQTPCVVTDVGDARRIVGDTGTVVPPENPIALTHALMSFESMSEQERQRLGVAARQRIADNYDIQAIAQQYARLYEAGAEHAA